ncbi:MAG: hypothetical protein AAGD25_12995 [Cyanobacteria bacterium P01_F01_bin.150]
MQKDYAYLLLLQSNLEAAMQGDIQAGLEQWRAIASLHPQKNATRVRALLQHYQGIELTR